MWGDGVRAYRGIAVIAGFWADAHPRAIGIAELIRRGSRACRGRFSEDNSPSYYEEAEEAATDLEAPK